VVIIGLTADNLVYVHTSKAKTGTTHIAYNVTLDRAELLQSADIAFLPQNLHIASYWLLLAGGIGGFIDAILLGGILCWRRLKSAELQVENGETTDHNLYPQTPLSIFIAVVAFTRSLAATIYSWFDWSASGTFDPSQDLTLSSTERYTPDFFTPDAWNCQLEDYIVSNTESNYLENLCREGTAARTMTLALCVLSAVVLYSVVYRTYKRRKVARHPRLTAFQQRNQSALSEAKTVLPEDMVTEK